MSDDVKRLRDESRSAIECLRFNADLLRRNAWLVTDAKERAAEYDRAADALALLERARGVEALPYRSLVTFMSAETPREDAALRLIATALALREVER